MQETQTETQSGGIVQNAQTMKFMQEKLEEKWEQERLEEEREERLYDEPIGPEPVGYNPEDEQAFYDFHGIEEGDILEWDDGEVNEVIGIVPAQQTIDEIEPLGDIVHVRVLEEMDDADEWANAKSVGEQNDLRDYEIGGGLARGDLTIRD